MCPTRCTARFEAALGASGHTLLLLVIARRVCTRRPPSCTSQHTGLAHGRGMCPYLRQHVRRAQAGSCVVKGTGRRKRDASVHPKSLTRTPCTRVCMCACTHMCLCMCMCISPQPRSPAQPRSRRCALCWRRSAAAPPTLRLWRCANRYIYYYVRATTHLCTTFAFATQLPLAQYLFARSRSITRITLRTSPSTYYSSTSICLLATHVRLAQPVY